MVQIVRRNWVFFLRNGVSKKQIWFALLPFFHISGANMPFELSFHITFGWLIWQGGITVYFGDRGEMMEDWLTDSIRGEAKEEA
jgi:hypothetical protein